MQSYFGRRRRAAAAVAFLLLGLIGAALPAAADPRGELQDIQERKARVQQQRQLKAAQAQKLGSRVQVLDRRRAAVEAQVDKLNSRVAEIDARINDVSEELSRAQRDIGLLTEELQDVLRRLDRRTDLFTRRAVAAYKAGPTAYLDSLLGSESMNELIERQEYYESALDSDSALVTQIQVLRDETDLKRDRIIEEEERIAAAKQRLESDRAEIAAVRNARADVLASREAVVSEKAGLLAQVKKDEARLARLEAQLAQDEQRLTSILQSQGSSTSGAFPVGGGQLAWPAAGPITSPYGYRTHPIFGDQRLHTGVDIGAPYGAPVVASDDGRVVFAGVMSGYGNAIVVDHGGGLATTYNHLSAFFVGSGQQVGRGSSIGAVGCSGYCTGPHLHFEVRINGSPVDPMPYLQ
jgi:murein DD-endopeptidase MepM/ murein hydrolase activator NlpD